MFKVECPGCKASYNVDERRVPADTGLKMRCPKCSTTFTVRRPDAGGDADLPAAKGADLPAAKPGAPKPGAPAPAPPRAPAPAPRPVASKPIAAPPPRGPEDSGLDLPAVPTRGGADLPAVPARGGAGADLPAVPMRGGAGADLPAVPARAGAGADLPAAKKPIAPKPVASRPVAPAPPPPEEDLLPAIRPAGGGGGGLEIDLPSPAGGRGDELDLPLVAAAGPGLPSPKAAAPRAAAAPAPPPPPRPRSPMISSDDLEAALPTLGAGGGANARAVTAAAAPRAARQVTGGALFDDYEAPGGSADLPSPLQGADLPSPRAGSDLPSLRGGSDLPAARANDPFADLPSPGFGGLDLPAPRGDDLPIPQRGADLPAPKHGLGGFGELDLPMPGASLPSPATSLPSPVAGSNLPNPVAGTNLPARRADPFADFGSPSAPPPHADFDAPLDFPPAPTFGSAPPAFGSAPPPAAGDDFFAKSAPPPPQQPDRRAGGTAFGEMDLGGGDAFGARPQSAPPPKPSTPAPAALGWGERDLGGGDDDDMEFGAIPQERGDAAPASRPPSAPASGHPASSAPRALAPPARRVVDTPDTPAKKGRGLKIAAVAAILVLVGGGALTVTPYGAFGHLIVYDAIKAKDWAAQYAATTKASQAFFAKDTADAAASALAKIQAEHQASPRATAIAAYGAYAGYYRQLRFGRDPAVQARAKTLLANIPAELNGNGYDLARAAQAAASDQLARGLSQTEAYLRRSPKDVDALALGGEIALASRDGDKALAFFAKLAELEPGARAQFGTARALYLKGKREEAETAAKKIEGTSPSHAGARLLLAKIAWQTSRDEATTTAYVDKVLKDPATRAAASNADLVDAHTLVGDMNLRRSRVSTAEAAFNEALKLDPKASGALTGVGEALYRAGRHAEALARFSSAMESDPEAILPKVGVAKTKIALERLQDAKELLRGLAKKLKDDGKPNHLVLSWLGRTEEAMGDKGAAEANYIEAIKLAGSDSDVVDTYVSLAQLLLVQGRPAEAQAKLDEAKAKLPRSVQLHKAMGDIAFQAGRYEEAEREYAAALAMDEGEIATRFKLGITLRRMTKFDAAAAAFDKVAAADKDYPSLALERAVLFEASGQAGKALEMYEAARAKAPDDPDLMLRVAAALLATGGTANAAKSEEMLRKVLQVRPNSAEANHYMGRALLAKGTALAEALRSLERARDGDPNRAEYWLYVGWAANDADQQAKAAEALNKALELDRSMADAYWQRGVLRRRQRAVIDAEADLKKALELRPSRFEAYATLAEVYEDQQKWPAALDAWNRAVSQNGNRGDWRFRLGKLMTQQGNRAGALEHLTKAHDLAMASEAKPAWLADCALNLADAERAAGKKELAVQHYQQYVSLVRPDAPYYKDACTALSALGSPCK